MRSGCARSRRLAAALLASLAVVLSAPPGVRPATPLAAAPAAGNGRAPVEDGELLIFAASDLAFALRELTAQFETSAGIRTTVVLGSSGQLAQQIAHGAPADVFLSANEAFVDDLEARGLLLRDTRTRYARGRLVVAYAASRAPSLPTVEGLQDSRIRRIAIANPKHAPYGQAAEQVLRQAGLWGSAGPRLVYADNIRQAVQFVQTGGAEAGLLAVAVADVPDVRWSLIDEALHAPLEQTAAVLRRTRQPAGARAFLAHLMGAEGQAVLRRFGFDPPGRD
jgi:molybdate transport system substrate-binding protein